VESVWKSDSDNKVKNNLVITLEATAMITGSEAATETVTVSLKICYILLCSPNSFQRDWQLPKISLSRHLREVVLLF
jgi:hypothetical protein